MTSRAFSGQIAARPHLVAPGKRGLPGEIADLRSDVEAAIDAVEDQIEPQDVACAVLRLDGQPTEDEELVIGADTYQYRDTAGGEDAGNINIQTGVSAAAALLNTIAAIQASGTERVFASLYNTDFLLVQQANEPGGLPAGTLLPGAPVSVALTETLTSMWTCHRRCQVRLGNRDN